MKPGQVQAFLAARSDLDLANLIELLIFVSVAVLLITLTPMAAIENELRFFGALGTGLRHFFPILVGYVRLYCATLVLAIAAAIVFFIVVIVSSLNMNSQQPVLGIPVVAIINLLLVIVAIVAAYAFQVFTLSLWFAYPAIVYRRLAT